ncbi:MAG TPA: efflux RND transporter periplasmic adaptor subunit [Burkholderiales bacterium]|nr:efflux RND transporter periplasmic adaptor subunit [Burkholderiales bacterium]
MSIGAIVRHPGWIALALVAAGAAVFFSRDVVLGKPVEAYQAIRGDLVQTVVASGRIITPQRLSVGAVVTEHVVRIPVNEGQKVRKGDVLIELDDRDERAALEQARASVAQAEAKVRQLREVGLPAAEQTLVQAEATALNARQQFERTKTLRERGFVVQSQLDDAQRARDIAEAQLRAARLQVETNKPTGSDFALAQTALEQARASLRAAQVKLEQTVIKAPVDGILIARNVEVGDVVQPGKELMGLAPAGETQVDVMIDERQLSRLALGQKALGSADAFSDQRFAAELVYINPAVDPLRGSVEVKLKVPDPPSYLVQDMTASVDIEVARKADTVYVPTETVRDANGAQPWVLAIRGFRAMRQPVKLGLRGDRRIEILDGIEAGDELIPATNGVVKAGQRVRAVAPQSASR